MEKVLFLFMRRMRRPLLALIFAYSIAIAGLVLIPGQDAMGNVWHYDFFHAFYFISFVGPTIGFGEIPYELLPSQRFWVTISLYMTVVSWLYAIGKMFALVQDPAFSRAVAEARFIRAVRRLDEPFHIVCGYGETGSLLVDALSTRGHRCVVLDRDSSRLDDLELADLPFDVPHLCANVSDTQILLEAGLRLSDCASVIAVTDSDEVNTKIAVTAKLLVPGRIVMCRAETSAAMENMASFDTDHIVNPYEIFAEHLGLAIRKPHINQIHRWLGSQPGRKLVEPYMPPKGRWLICGYGRFGRACRRFLEASDIEVTVIERSPDSFHEELDESLKHRIIGSATDPEPLHEAGVESCAGIIAGTDSDTDNLSIVLTARAINPEIYAVARQNRRAETELFVAAQLPMFIEPSRIIVWRMLPLVTIPLLYEFLALCRCQEDDWGGELLDIIQAMTRKRTPEVFSLKISAANGAGLSRAIRRRTVRLADLGLTPVGEPLHFVPLLLRTRDEVLLRPKLGQTLAVDDELLIACTERASHRMQWLATHSDHWGRITIAEAAEEAAAPG